MNKPVQALIWEQVWKNRMVFPLLGILLVVGAVVTHLLRGAESTAWWVRTAQEILLVSFLASLLLSFAPFTLMESHRGWRMNSMVTRWFALPVPTSLLVAIPYMGACLVVSVVAALWMALLNRLIPELEAGHLFLALLLGVAALQTLAWILPRRPSQFWPLLALGLPLFLLLAVAPLDGPSWEPQRRLLRSVVPFALPVLGLVAYTAARLNRSGVWPGEIPWNRLTMRLGQRWTAVLPVRTPGAALFWSDAFPVVRTFVFTWTGFLVVVGGLQLAMLIHRSAARGFDFGMVLQTFVVLIPPLGVLWMTFSGLFLGAEPGLGFRTAVGPLRATRPVTEGMLVAQRVIAALLIALLVWVPWLVLVTLHTRLHPEWANVDTPGIRASVARLMVLSAHGMIGALPLYLWGRIDGFPNMLLAGMVAWAGTWGLANLFPFDPPEPGSVWVWRSLGTLLVLKFVLGGAFLSRAWRHGLVSGRFVLSLTLGWIATVALLVAGFSIGPQRGWWGVGTLMVLMPFARLAAAPLALAANRHR